jgi:methionyl-tRNA formyltransferase
LISADLCFYLSFSQIVPVAILSKFKNNLVVHESDLPHGRGWSPLTWQILEGKEEIAITLFEASDQVDSGPIYLKSHMRFKGSELFTQLKDTQAVATIKLYREFIENYPAALSGAVQQHGRSSSYVKRTPSDSQLDTSRSIREQFNSLRVADNSTYPAHFEIDGNFYELWIKNMDV